MALITRVARLFTADVHAVLDRIEEPEVVLKMAIREMAEELARDEQRMRWIETERQQLEQRQQESLQAAACFDEELDLCFAAGEEQLARSLVKRKLTVELQQKQAGQQIDGLRREQHALTESAGERRSQLADMQQKADLLADTPDCIHPAAAEAAISQDAVDVAFLRERQRRQENRSPS
jgi:phage shock protein A